MKIIGLNFEIRDCSCYATCGKAKGVLFCPNDKELKDFVDKANSTNQIEKLLNELWFNRYIDEFVKNSSMFEACEINKFSYIEKSNKSKDGVILGISEEAECKKNKYLSRFYTSGDCSVLYHDIDNIILSITEKNTDIFVAYYSKGLYASSKKYTINSEYDLEKSDCNLAEEEIMSLKLLQ